MEFILNDEEIKTLLKEPKIVQLEFDDFFRKWKPKKGYTEFDVLFKGMMGAISPSSLGKIKKTI